MRGGRLRRRHSRWIYRIERRRLGGAGAKNRVERGGPTRQAVWRSAAALWLLPSRAVSSGRTNGRYQATSEPGRSWLRSARIRWKSKVLSGDRNGGWTAAPRTSRGGRRNWHAR